MLLLALLAAAVSPQQAVPRPGELKTFRDWTVGCDNGRACHATSLMPEGEIADSPLTMSIKRGPAVVAVERPSKLRAVTRTRTRSPRRPLRRM